MTVSRAFSSRLIRTAGPQSQRTERARIIETKPLTVTQQLPKRWYNLDDVLTDDFPRN